MSVYSEIDFNDTWYREATEASLMLVWACDRDGRFIYLNSVWEQSHGYKVEEMLGRCFSEFQRPEIYERDVPMYARSLREEPVLHYTTSHVAKDGSDIHLIFNAKHLKDGNDHIIGMQGTGLVINDQKLLEERIDIVNDDFERFFTLIPELACVASTDGHFIKLNPFWERTLGFTVGELLDAPLTDFIHPDDIAATIAAVTKQVEGEPVEGFVNRYRHKDGSYRYFQWEATPSKGNTLYAVARDITEQLRLEEMLRRKERRNRIELELSNSAPESLQQLYDLALEEVISVSGSKFGYIFHYDDESQNLTLHAWSQAAMHLCTVANPKTVYYLPETGVWGDVVRLARPVIINDLYSECRRGSRLPAGHVPITRFLSIPVFSNGRITAVVGVGNKEEEYTEADSTDLTLLSDRIWQVISRRKTEISLRESHERLRQLSTHMESVREEERLRISREVHDELGQMMTALRFDIASLKGHPALPQELRDKLDKMDTNVRTAIVSVQNISSELRPKLLDDLGLASAIKWHVDNFAKTTGIVCSQKISPSLPPLTPHCAIALFRIVQEAFTNIQRHAAATCVHLELCCRANEIVLIVSDNGRGIRDEELFAGDSFGVMGMHERALSCSGELSISGNIGGGTTLRLGIPVPSRAKRSVDR